MLPLAICQRRVLLLQSKDLVLMMRPPLRLRSHVTLKWMRMARLPFTAELAVFTSGPNP
jgi:nitrate reductase gamma subunit